MLELRSVHPGRATSRGRQAPVERPITKVARPQLSHPSKALSSAAILIVAKLQKVSETA
ncbi:hypothetical protein EV560_108119 [Bosea sp. BK604]|nr:hypothetical protein EV560_108119 [Bosea sp. BK604]